MKTHEAYLRDLKRVEARINFNIHIIIYGVVIILLFLINLTTSAEHIWFKWPFIGWGIIVFFHALKTFVFTNEKSIKQHLIIKRLKKETLR